MRQVRRSRRSSSIREVGAAGVALVFTLVFLAPLSAPSVAAQTAVNGRSPLGPSTSPTPAGVVTPRTGLWPLYGIPFNASPIGLAYDGASSVLDVLQLSNNVSFVAIGNNSIVLTASLPPDGYISAPVAIAYDNQTGLVFVTQWTQGLCAGCGGPVTLAINGSTGKLVAENDSMQGLDVPDYLDCLTFVPQTGLVYACDWTDPGRLLAFHGSTAFISDSTRIGAYPTASAFDPANSMLYVTNWGSDNVTVVNLSSNAVAGWIPVGSQPTGIAFDGANGYLYVTNNASDNVTVINGGSDRTLASIPVGCNPEAVAYDAASGDVYVANPCSDNLTAISGTTNAVLGSVPVGENPVAVLYDPADQEVYVANAGSDNVSVLSSSPTRAYPVTFTTSPTNCGRITFNGTDYTNGQWAEYAAGVYPVSALGCQNYWLESLVGSGFVSVSSGQATVSGSGAVTATFTASSAPPAPQYLVTFVTDPTNCGSIEFNGTWHTDGQSVEVPAGSYDVATLACSGYRADGLAGSGSLSVSSGVATVSGAGSLSASFASQTSPSVGGLIGLSGNTGYYLLAAAGVALVAVAVGVLLARRIQHEAPRDPPGTGSSAGLLDPGAK